MNAGRVRERLTALFIAGIVLINYPLVQLFGEGRRILGIPLLYLYLFGCWALVIAVIALVMERRAGQDKPGAGGGDSGRG